MHYLAGFQDLYMFLKYCVTVFLDETLDLVLYMVSKVMDDESSRRHSRLLEMHMLPVFAV